MQPGVQPTSSEPPVTPLIEPGLVWTCWQGEEIVLYQLSFDASPRALHPISRHKPPELASPTVLLDSRWSKLDTFVAIHFRIRDEDPRVTSSDWGCIDVIYLYDTRDQTLQQVVSDDHHMLQCAYQAVEQSGYFQSKSIDKKIGCYVGNLGEDWLEMLAQDTENFGIYRLSGYGDFSLSNRISYEMNLQGPRYVPPPPAAMTRPQPAPTAAVA